MPFGSKLPFSFLLLSLVGLATLDTLAEEPIVPLYNDATKLEPATSEETDTALVTRIADRVRDRHAREGEFHAYDHYLSWYWQERTFKIEIVDEVAKGGKRITVNIESLTPLNGPNFRCFYRGKNTVAEYLHNAIAKEVGKNRYSTVIRHNPRERRGLKVGDKMEFEFSSFLAAPKNGRTAYYGTALLYVVCKGIVPWRGVGERLDSEPLPSLAMLGGRTTLHYQYSDEPKERFKQMATNMSPTSAQSFMLGRRLHHTDFGSGAHSEGRNQPYKEQAGKLGPGFVARSCVACHVNNGRAMPPMVNSPMYQTVIKLGAKSKGGPHAELGTALQPQSTAGSSEASAVIERYSLTKGQYGDGTPYELRKPVYKISNGKANFYSVRLAPALVGLGLLEAIREQSIIAKADPNDVDQDGISGRAQRVLDPETGELRLGRFGYKAGQARIRHQIANALNSDMGVSTSVFPRLDGETTAESPELSDSDLDDMTRYLSTLGVSARRKLEDPVALQGEKLFSAAGCAKCHLPKFTTSPYHPFAELRSQSIAPYTDLLLHDMGKGLADNLGEGGASGSEWRTAPLWSIGLTQGVHGKESYLHDGRARSLEEAILWHGGEGEKAKEAFRIMPQKDRNALVQFLKSL